jgi:hypothetical protein
MHMSAVDRIEDERNKENLLNPGAVAAIIDNIKEVIEKKFPYPKNDPKIVHDRVRAEQRPREEIEDDLGTQIIAISKQRREITDAAINYALLVAVCPEDWRPQYKAKYVEQEQRIEKQYGRDVVAILSDARGEAEIRLATLVNKAFYPNDPDKKHYYQKDDDTSQFMGKIIEAVDRVISSQQGITD